MRKQADYDTELLCKDYLDDILTLPNIAKKHAISVATIYDVLRKNGLSVKRQDNRKNVFNYNYFDEINSSDKAYFLGFLYADGNNYPETYTIQLKLKEDDINILKTFINYIANSEYPLKGVNRKEGHKQCNLILSNKHTSNKLIEKGLIKNKTFFIEFPTEEQVPKHLIHHFIRGYFDGDGCIQSYLSKKSKNPDYSFIISGSYQFLDKCQDILIEQLQLRKTKLTKVKSIYNMCYGGNNQVIAIYNWLYKDCDDLYLTRKKEKFEELCKQKQLL